MKRVNIYIKEDEDKTIDHLTEILDSNRSEIIRLAVREFAEHRQTDIDNFLEGLVDDEDLIALEDNRINEERFEFIKKCMDEPIFFAENAIACPTVDLGLTNIKLYNLQKEILSELNHRKRVIINKSRQMGGTLLQLINVAHYILFNQDKTVVLMSNKHTNAIEMLRNLKDMLDTLPAFMQPKLTIKNKTCIQLDNGCIIRASACTVDALRGMTISYLLIDEAAFIKREIFDEFMMSVMPVLMATKSTIFHIASTPNGPNHFMKLFGDAICNYINFYGIEVPWNLIPGRDENWKEDIIDAIGLERFQQEYECKFIYRRGIGHGI